MKLSTKSRYGLKAMYYLGSFSDEVLSLKTISKYTAVPEPYLEKLLGVLRKNNLIVTVRGSYGGYKIQREPSLISIGEIIGCLEGNMYLADCNAGVCNNPKCPNKDMFNFLYLKIKDVFNNISLEDMINNISFSKNNCNIKEIK